MEKCSIKGVIVKIHMPFPVVIVDVVKCNVELDRCDRFEILNTFDRLSENW